MNTAVSGVLHEGSCHDVIVLLGCWGGGNGHSAYAPFLVHEHTQARMEQTSLPGCIQVSAATRALLPADLSLRPTGGVEIKGKGVMKVRALAADRLSGLRLDGHGNKPTTAQRLLAICTMFMFKRPHCSCFTLVWPSWQ